MFGRKDFPPGNKEIPKMSGFATSQASMETWADPAGVMDSFDPKELPIITTLAKEFKACTNWYSSIPTNTDPNKYFYHVGTSLGNNE